MNIQGDRFAEFFRELHGYDPFPWQERLAERVTAADAIWPECLALPTSSGKTTCIDIAVFALACEAALPAAKRSAPRRILFVVDRRVIVDEAYAHALKLAESLDTAKSGILKVVADALRRIAGGATFEGLNPVLADAPPLTCHQLRGGMYRDEAWARTPTQPCVIASTVDQIGSRLLFRGYGSSFKSWPLQAGLAANDSLIILDEAHCSQPFFETMQSVTRYRGSDWARSPIRIPFAFTIMSATPPTGVPGDRVFRLNDADRNATLANGKANHLAKRMSVSKPASLAIADKAKGKSALSDLAMELVGRAAGLAEAGRRRIGILVNRVETARRVATLLEALQRHGTSRAASDGVNRNAIRSLESLGGFDVVLLTGRMRPVDRDDLLHGWRPSAGNAEYSHDADTAKRGLLAWLGTAGDRPDLPRPVFVVATQCLEVGANLDFDALVTECASLDALRQRFGRLNRVARTEDPAGATIVIRQDQTPGSGASDDPVYGMTLAATWEWLNSIAATASDSTAPVVDFGVEAMDAHVKQAESSVLSSLVRHGTHAPVMLPAHVDCWAQTAPEPTPTPAMSLFLHGKTENAPEIQVCWRADVPQSLSQGDDEQVDSALVAVAMSPPTTLECMPVPIPVFVKWWRSDGDAALELSDVPAIELEEPPSGWSNNRLAFIWRGPEESVRLENTRDLRPGDTVVLPVAAGGWDTFGHIPAGPKDVADRCHLLARRSAALRIHPVLVQDWPDGGDAATLKVELLALLREVDEPDETVIVDLLRRLHEELSSTGEGVPPNALWLVDSLSLLVQSSRQSRTWSYWQWQDGTREDTKVWEIGLRGKRHRKTDDFDRTREARLAPNDTESHTDDSSSDSAPTTLAAHCRGVAVHARQFAEICAVSPELLDVFELAGRLHDLGKADWRFQAFLFGGNLLAAESSSRLFAKSTGLRVERISDRRAARDSLLPLGFRHELLSLALIENCPRLQRELVHLDGLRRDLVLHLVAVHHGWCRPFAPIVRDSLASPAAPSDRAELLSIDLTGAEWEVSVSHEERRRWVPPHRLDSEISSRFWRLVRSYGWWGLAWLEAVFVLADHRQSEWEADDFLRREAETVESAR